MLRQHVIILLGVQGLGSPSGNGITNAAVESLLAGQKNGLKRAQDVAQNINMT